MPDVTRAGAPSGALLGAPSEWSQSQCIAILSLKTWTLERFGSEETYPLQSAINWRIKQILTENHVVVKFDFLIRSKRSWPKSYEKNRLKAEPPLFVFGLCFKNNFLKQANSVNLSFAGLFQQNQICSKTVVKTCSDCIRSGPYCVWCKQLVGGKLGATS